ncbi:MAG: CPBP family intramembrane glutamic endopeptidase [Pseudomonadota bacterium]
MQITGDIRTALFAYVSLLIISFSASIIGGFGQAESLHDPACVWLYVRRLLMAGCALLLPFAGKEKGLSAYGWHLSGKWLGISLPLGVAIGFSNKGGFEPVTFSAIALACFHAFATELFFRAYLITTLSKTLKTFWPPILISSFLYGIFYMTVWTAWNQPGPIKLLFIFLFTAIGVLHGYCYKKSGSFLVPWAMHFLGVLNYRVLF